MLSVEISLQQEMTMIDPEIKESKGTIDLDNGNKAGPLIKSNKEMKGRKNKESTKIGPDQEIIRVIKNMEKVKKIEVFLFYTNPQGLKYNFCHTLSDS